MIVEDVEEDHHVGMECPVVDRGHIVVSHKYTIRSRGESASLE